MTKLGFCGLIWSFVAAGPGCGGDSGGNADASADGCDGIAPCETLTESADSTTSGTTASGTETGQTTDPTAGSGTTSDGGDLPPGEDCVEASDCVIDDDCCHCFAYAMLPETHECEFDGLCEETECQQRFEGLPPELACVNGNCVFALFDCDPANVVCGGPPPECSELDVPAVIDGCWGPCIRGSDCSGSLYPGATCPEGTVELRRSACSGDSCGSYTTCVPAIDGCGELLTCDCGVEELCGQSPWSCYDSPAGAFCCTGDAQACASAG